jgi:hypothetical protein
MEDLASARMYLRDAPNGEMSTYTHLASLLQTIIRDKPATPLAAFEALSVTVKQSRLQQQQAQQLAAAKAKAAASGAPAPVAAVPAGPVVAQAGVLGIDLPNSELVTDATLLARLAAHLLAEQHRIKKPKKANAEGEEEEEEEEPETNPNTPDLVQQAAMLKEAGTCARAARAGLRRESCAIVSRDTRVKPVACSFVLVPPSCTLHTCRHQLLSE